MMFRKVFNSTFTSICLSTIVSIVLSLVLLNTAHALDRTQLAKNANSVTPLLDGNKIPNANVNLADGSPVSLQGLIMQKPSVVVFYRGGWCPYCNRQLAGLKNIEPALIDLGYQVIAISPESPERLQEQKLQTEFAVTLVSDKNLEAIKGFGIAYLVEETTSTRYSNRGVKLTENDKGQAVLPAPGIFIVDQAGVVNFSYVNPDFRHRPSEALILAAATALK